MDGNGEAEKRGRPRRGPPRRVARKASDQAGVDQTFWQSSASMNLALPVVWDGQARTAIHVTATVAVGAPAVEVAPVVEPKGVGLPVNRDDLTVWLWEARDTLANDVTPSEYRQLTGAASGWPDIVRSRSELLDIEREQRDLARSEGRKYKPKGRRPQPTKAALARLDVVLRYVLMLEHDDRALMVSWLEGVGATAIGRFVGVSKQAIDKRLRKAGDKMWARISADHTTC